MVPSKIFCTNCGTANRIESAFCFACGQPLQTSSPTSVSPASQDAAARSAYSSRVGQPVTRSLIKERYRIIARLGNGVLFDVSPDEQLVVNACGHVGFVPASIEP